MVVTRGNIPIRNIRDSVTRVRMIVTQGCWVTGWEVAGWETEPRLVIEVG